MTDPQTGLANAFVLGYRDSKASWLSCFSSCCLFSVWAKCSAFDCLSSNSVLLSCFCLFLIKRNEEGFFFCTCKINTNQNYCYSLIHPGLWSASAFLFSHWECTTQEGLHREGNRLPLPIWLTQFNAAIMLGEVHFSGKALMQAAHSVWGPDLFI